MVLYHLSLYIYMDIDTDIDIYNGLHLVQNVGKFQDSIEHISFWTDIFEYLYFQEMYEHFALFHLPCDLHVWTNL